MLFVHYILTELIKFMNLSIRIRIIYNVRHGYAIRLKFGGKLVTFLTK